jgi:hypothetical protein
MTMKTTTTMKTTNPASYIARMTALPGKRLAGGVKVHHSSRWGDLEDARDYIDSIQSIDPDAQGEVVASELPPEIFRHCRDSEMPQAIGGRCEACGKIVTAADARAFVRLNSGPDRVTTL